MPELTVKDTVESISLFRRHSKFLGFVRNLFRQGQKVKRRIVFFFPHNLSIPRTGAHARAYRVLSCLREIGCEVLLFSSTIFSDSPWNKEDVERLNCALGIDIYVHKGTPADIEHLANYESGDDWRRFTPPDMLAAFEQIAASYHPDLLLVNYALWGRLATAVPSGTRKIIEMHDLVTLNNSMRRAIGGGLGRFPIDPWQVDDAILNRNFCLDENYVANEEEYRIYDEFDTTIAISSKEGVMVAAHTNHTRVVYIPQVFPINEMFRNDYGGAPVFVIGVNMFNFQGYAFWVRRILPYLLERQPNFCLEVYGDGCNHVREAAGTHLNGFVTELAAIYARAPFAVCPLLAGTGQQVKVVEAMSYGVPVVVMKGVSESSPVVHGENGFVAATAEDFAEYCLRLYGDRRLCRRLGVAAREKVSAEYSVERMRTSLAQVFC
jgi:glycosyltransferase involved in cell wall biosynthesis